MVRVMCEENCRSSTSHSSKADPDLCLDVEDFPVFLKTENLLMHGAVKEVDPRNLKDTVDMDVFLFEDYIVLAVCNELREISYKKTDCVLKLFELKFFFDENNIMSMDTTTGESFPDGNRIRLFRVPEASTMDWVCTLRKCDVRVEMKERLAVDHEKHGVIHEEEELSCNSRRIVTTGDYKNKPIGDCRPRSYSHDPKLSHNVADMNFALPPVQPALDNYDQTSNETVDSDVSSEQSGKRSLQRSLSVDNTPAVSMSNASKPNSSSLPNNFKSLKVKQPKSKSPGVVQYIVRKTMGLTKSAPVADQGSAKRHIGMRFAQPSPELDCTRSADRRESHMTISMLDPVQVAQELTRCQAEMWLAISPRELQNGYWNTAEKYERSPYIMRMIELHNHTMSCVFGRWILQERTPEKRAKVIKRLIGIAEECRQLQNFDTVHTIISCLSTHAIHRLKKTWSLLSRNTYELYNTLYKLMHFEKNWGSYRHALKSAKRKGYFVPILPVFLYDVEHSFPRQCQERNINKLVYIEEDDMSWIELRKQKGEEYMPSGKKSGSISKGSFKWLRSKSLSTSPSPLLQHIEDKLRENVQSIVDQTNSGKEDSGKENFFSLTLEETPHFLLRLYQQNCAQYNLPSTPVVATFLELPYLECVCTKRHWADIVEEMVATSLALEPSAPK